MLINIRLIHSSKYLKKENYGKYISKWKNKFAFTKLYLGDIEHCIHSVFKS